MINVVCAIIVIDNKILVTQRSGNMQMPFKWEFPGGKLEANESEIDCVKREIKEEINIEIEIIQKLTNSVHSYPTFTINLIPFLAYYVSGNIQLLEHLRHRFLKIDELSQLDWADADISIVRQIQALTI
ncbi:MAG: (deoxy)nucleoside triphosphate pyrophosphohydrolase [Flavobacterium sp.]|nr:MAG: (deoxy)nucleoside triphosphate pyrophosphohydrolase [Flavobacterium sp.]